MTFLILQVLSTVTSKENLNLHEVHTGILILRDFLRPFYVLWFLELYIKLELLFTVIYSSSELRIISFLSLNRK